jgi:hypothetical protein
MRKPCVLLIALFFPAVAVAGDAPFLPFPTAVDHAATMVAKRDARETGERVVTHHAGWTRIDEVANGHRTTDYFGHAGFIALSTTRSSSGEYVFLSISRGREERGDLDHRSFSTGERQVFLGESCEVWNILRTSDTRPGSVRLTKLGCITDDGIELWHKIIGEFQDRAGQWVQGATSSIEATKIERRTVQPSEVRPPADILVLKSWVDPVDSLPAAAASPIDFEVVMETDDASLTGGGRLIRTKRQHGSWTYTDSVAGDGRRKLLIENETSHTHLRFESGSAGEFKRLFINKFPSGAAAQSTKPLEDGRKETILAEECRWFYMTPGANDAGFLQCRTPDGVVLKETHWSIGSRETLTAVRLQRRAVALPEVLPPDQVLTRQNWGIPE